MAAHWYKNTAPFYAVEYCYYQDMLVAAKNGRIDEIKELLDMGVNVDGKDDVGISIQISKTTKFSI